jgi:hypothetical protein
MIVGPPLISFAVMPPDSHELRYASGEVAQAGDHVDNDGWKSVVTEVIATPEQCAFRGVGEPGLMMRCSEAGLVFEPRSSVSWDAIVFERRGP